MSEAYNCKSFDFATDTVKQIISLSTGIITILVTFGDKFALSGWVISTALVLFLGAVFWGFVSLAALTGTFDKLAQGQPASIYAKNIRIFVPLQYLCFIAALILSACSFIGNHPAEKGGPVIKSSCDGFVGNFFSGDKKRTVSSSCKKMTFQVTLDQ